MKSLLIIRHAKSSWEQPKLADFDRPLNARGLRNGPEMAQRLVARSVEVQALYCSAARRTYATAEMLAQALGLDVLDIQPQEALYHVTAQGYTQFVRSLPDGVDSAAIIGHNPGLTDWVNALTQSSIENVPTLGMALVQFPEAVSWQDVGPAVGKLIWYDYPKKPFDLS